MSAEPSEYERIRRSAQESFADFVHKRKITDDPGLVPRHAARGGWKARLLGALSWVSANNFRVRGKRYVFLNTRLGALVARYSDEAAAIVGGPSDWGFARRHGLSFCFSGDLYAAAFHLLFGAGRVPSRRIVGRWLRFFSQQQKPCYLVVANDTMPLAMLLVQIARRCPDVVVVCVQHGLLSAGPLYQYDDVEGRNSHVNLVYTQAQRREMERRLPGALVEVMGFPCDFPPLDPGEPERTAVLVGVGSFEDLSALKVSLRIFGEVGARLARAGWRVEYRPHPSESGLGLLPSEFPTNRQDKRELLAGRRRLFLGFGSTLLYEAEVAGHAVLVLDDPELPGYSIADFGTRLDAHSLDELDERAQVALFAPSAAPAMAGVRERFEQALSRALARRHNDTPSERA